LKKAMTIHKFLNCLVAAVWIVGNGHPWFITA